MANFLNRNFLDIFYQYCIEIATMTSLFPGGIKKYALMLISSSLLIMKCASEVHSFSRMEMDHTKLEYSQNLNLLETLCTSVASREGDDVIN